jgi:hypothetical protein
MKKFFLLSMLFCYTQFASAQDNNSSTNNDKLFEHSVGLQVNQLIRQVLNFSNTTTPNNNPYLLTYGIRNLKNNWGLRLGLGYNYNANTSDDGITKSDNKINDLQLRLGIEKYFEFSDHWVAGVGLDGLLNINNDKTTTVVVSTDTSTSVTNTTLGSYGLGVMSWIRYNITDYISIGTEASFYYTSGNQKQDITNTTQATSGGQSSYNVSTSKLSNTISNGTISLPVALFISIRF